ARMMAVAELVLAGTVRDPALRETIAGDLAEDHATVVRERGRWRGGWWLIRQLAISLPYLTALRADALWPCDARRIAALYGRMAIVAAVSVALAELALAATARLPLAVAAPSLVVAAVVVGFALARSARRAPLVASMAAGVLGAGVGLGALAL